MRICFLRKDPSKNSDLRPYFINIFYAEKLLKKMIRLDPS